MITELVIILRKGDPLIKRNVLKTISWRIIGSIDTVLLSWLITGNFSLGIKIGGTELFTKMLLYYFHERIWQHSQLGLPSRLEKNNSLKQSQQSVLFKQHTKVSREDRETLNGNSSFTIWMTGLSGSGKSTLSIELEAWMFDLGYRTFILDGDNTRLGINSDLSFSDDDRTENIRRVGEICKLLNEAGVIVIASFISPFAKDRITARQLIGHENFVEVFVDATLETCLERDTKGLYKRAIDGEIQGFTGISSPYENPIDPDIHVRTDQKSIQTCLQQMQEYLVKSKRTTIKLNHSLSVDS